jgi:hypothetical protein
LVGEILTELGKTASIKSTFRLKPKNGESRAHKDGCYPLVVAFDSEEKRNEILSVSKNLVKCEKFKNVFVEIQRTGDEQNEFQKLLRERNEANNNLEKDGRLNRPYRFVIRSNRVRCIDTTNTIRYNGRDVNPFVSREEEKEARKRAIQSVSE